MGSKFVNTMNPVQNRQVCELHRLKIAFVSDGTELDIRLIQDSDLFRVRFCQISTYQQMDNIEILSKSQNIFPLDSLHLLI